jgi:hypothetical protein
MYLNSAQILPQLIFPNFHFLKPQLHAVFGLTSQNLMWVAALNFVSHLFHT